MLSIQRIIDKYVGRLVITLLVVFRLFNRHPKRIRKILVIKLWAMGDSILTLSLIKGIRESFEGCRVDVLLRSKVKDVYECYPVDSIYNLDSFSGVMKLMLNIRSYDVVFDCEPYFNLSAILALYLGKERVGFAHQFRSCLYTKKTNFHKDQHMVQNYLDMLRCLNREYDTQKLEQLTVDENGKTKVERFISEHFGGKTIVGITPGIAESSKNRMWYEERFAELSDLIIGQLDCRVLIIDSPENKETVKKVKLLMKNKPIDSLDKFTLKETFYLISKCRVFISNDTGPMHIAAAQGCSTIGLFGPNTPVLWAPYGKGNTAIYKTGLEPAIQNDKGIFRECNREEYMGCITVDDVFEAVKQSLQKTDLV